MPTVIPLELMKDIAKNSKAFSDTQEPYSMIMPESGFLSGHSKLDRGFTLYGNDEEDNLRQLEETRAQNQSSIDKVSNGIVKGLGIMGTTILGSAADIFVGLPAGIASAAQGKGFIEGFANNEVQKSFDRFNENMETWFPNYYTEKEKKASALSPDNWFTANFLGDKMFKMAGFSAGAIVSGLLTAGVGTEMSVGRMLTKAALSRKLFMFSKAVEAAGKTYKTADEVVNALKQYNRIVKFSKGADLIMGSIGSAHYEAAMEARQAGNGLREKLMQKYGMTSEMYNMNPEQYNRTMAAIDEQVTSVMNGTFMANMAILSVGEELQFGRLFTQGFKGERQALNNIIRGVTGEYKQEVPKMITNIGKTYGKNMLVEGWEEGSQFVAAETFKKYVENRGTGKENVDEFMTSLADATQKVFNTKEGAENIMIGALMGGIIGGGMNAYYNRKNKDGSKERETRTESLVGFINTNKLDAPNSPLAKYITKLTNNYYQAQNAQNQNNRKLSALEKNDPHSYNSVEYEQLADMVYNYADNGLYDIFREQLLLHKGLSSEEFTKTYGVPVPANKTVSDIIDSIVTKTDRLYNIHEDIATRFPNIETFYYKSKNFKGDDITEQVNRRKDLYNILSKNEYYKKRKSDLSDELLGKSDGIINWQDLDKYEEGNSEDYNYINPELQKKQDDTITKRKQLVKSLEDDRKDENTEIGKLHSKLKKARADQLWEIQNGGGTISTSPTRQKLSKEVTDLENQIKEAEKDRVAEIEKLNDEIDGLDLSKHYKGSDLESKIFDIAKEYRKHLEKTYGKGHPEVDKRAEEALTYINELVDLRSDEKNAQTTFDSLETRDWEKEQLEAIEEAMKEQRKKFQELLDSIDDVNKLPDPKHEDNAPFKDLITKRKKLLEQSAKIRNTQQANNPNTQTQTQQPQQQNNQSQNNQQQQPNSAPATKQITDAQIKENRDKFLNVNAGTLYSFEYTNAKGETHKVKAELVRVASMDKVYLSEEQKDGSYITKTYLFKNITPDSITILKGEDRLTKQRRASAKQREVDYRSKVLAVKAFLANNRDIDKLSPRDKSLIEEIGGTIQMFEDFLAISKIIEKQKKNEEVPAEDLGIILDANGELTTTPEKIGIMIDNYLAVLMNVQATDQRLTDRTSKKDIYNYFLDSIKDTMFMSNPILYDIFDNALLVKDTNIQEVPSAAPISEPVNVDNKTPDRVVIASMYDEPDSQKSINLQDNSTTIYLDIIKEVGNVQPINGVITVSEKVGEAVNAVVNDIKMADNVILKAIPEYEDDRFEKDRNVRNSNAGLIPIGVFDKNGNRLGLLNVIPNMRYDSNNTNIASNDYVVIHDGVHYRLNNNGVSTWMDMLEDNNSLDYIIENQEEIINYFKGEPISNTDIVNFVSVLINVNRTNLITNPEELNNAKQHIANVLFYGQEKGKLDKTKLTENLNNWKNRIIQDTQVTINLRNSVAMAKGSPITTGVTHKSTGYPILTSNVGLLTDRLVDSNIDDITLLHTSTSDLNSTLLYDTETGDMYDTGTEDIMKKRQKSFYTVLTNGLTKVVFPIYNGTIANNNTNEKYAKEMRKFVTNNLFLILEELMNSGTSNEAIAQMNEKVNSLKDNLKDVVILNYNNKEYVSINQTNDPAKRNIVFSSFSSTGDVKLYKLSHDGNKVWLMDITDGKADNKKKAYIYQIKDNKREYDNNALAEFYDAISGIKRQVNLTNDRLVAGHEENYVSSHGKQTTRFKDPVDGTIYKSYKEYLIKTGALVTNIGLIKDTKGKKISNFSSGGNRPIVLHIADKKIEASKPAPTPSQQPNFRDSLANNMKLDDVIKQLDDKGIFKVLKSIAPKGLVFNLKRLSVQEAMDTLKIGEEDAKLLNAAIHNNVIYTGHNSMYLNKQDFMLEITHEITHSVIKKGIVNFTQEQKDALNKDITTFLDSISSISDDELRTKYKLNRIEIDMVKNYLKLANEVNAETGVKEEAITYAFTNRTIAGLLAKIQVADKQTGKKTSAWGKLKELITKVLEVVTGNTKLDELHSILDKHFIEGKAPLNMGFDALGNIGNVGMSIMEKEVIEKGKHIIHSINRASKEQRIKIEKDIVELKSKYPDKNIVHRIENNSLIVEVIKSDTDSTKNENSSNTIQDKQKEYEAKKAEIKREWDKKLLEVVKKETLDDLINELESIGVLSKEQAADYRGKKATFGTFDTPILMQFAKSNNVSISKDKLNDYKNRIQRRGKIENEGLQESELPDVILINEEYEEKLKDLDREYNTPSPTEIDDTNISTVFTNTITTPTVSLDRVLESPNMEFNITSIRGGRGSRYKSLNFPYALSDAREELQSFDIGEEKYSITKLNYGTIYTKYRNTRDGLGELRKGYVEISLYVPSSQSLSEVEIKRRLDKMMSTYKSFYLNTDSHEDTDYGDKNEDVVARKAIFENIALNKAETNELVTKLIQLGYNQEQISTLTAEQIIDITFNNTQASEYFKEKGKRRPRPNKPGDAPKLSVSLNSNSGNTITNNKIDELFNNDKSLGKSIVTFMMELDSESRAIMRDMINNKEIEIKCKSL